MSERDPKAAFRQILAYAREAVEITSSKSRQDLDRERMLNLALTRLLEMLGEAANRVPPDIQAKHPNIPWLQMIAVRNRLIHGYDSVDFDILWSITKNDLPGLITQLEKILETE